MATIDGALDRLVALQLALAITSPADEHIKAAHKEPPPMSSGLPDVPCWINWLEYPTYRRSNAMREREYIVHMQLFVSDVDRASGIARAFKEQLDTALDNDVTLNGACTLQRNLRGGERELEWAGKKFRGLDLMLDVLIGYEAATLGP